MNQTEKSYAPDVATIFPAGYPKRCRGRFASSTMRCGFHPLLARRKAPHNQRMQQTIPLANKFASGLAPDPQRIIQRK